MLSLQITMREKINKTELQGGVAWCQREVEILHSPTTALRMHQERNTTSEVSTVEDAVTEQSLTY